MPSLHRRISLCAIRADLDTTGWRSFQGRDGISPWKPWRELDAAQRAYEQEQLESLSAQNAEYEAALAEIEAALGVNT